MRVALSGMITSTQGISSRMVHHENQEVLHNKSVTSKLEDQETVNRVSDLLNQIGDVNML